MPHNTPVPSPSLLAHTTLTFGRVYDGCPEDVSVIQSFVTERLSQNFRSQIKKASTDAERYALVGVAFNEVFPATMASEKCQKALHNMLTEYGKLPSTPDTQLEGTPGANSLMLAIGLGLVAGGVIVGAICLYIWATS